MLALPLPRGPHGPGRGGPSPRASGPAGAAVCAAAGSATRLLLLLLRHWRLLHLRGLCRGLLLLLERCCV